MGFPTLDRRNKWPRLFGVKEVCMRYVRNPLAGYQSAEPPAMSLLPDCRVCGNSVAGARVEDTSSELLPVQNPIQNPPRLAHPRAGAREEVFVDGDRDNVFCAGAGEQCLDG